MSARLPLVVACIAVATGGLYGSQFAPLAYAASAKGPSQKDTKARAQALSAEAKEAFKAMRYDDAADLFMQVYDLVKNEASVYNAARAKELGGKLGEAKALYELFLRINKAPQGQAEAAKRVGQIEETLRQQVEGKAKAEAQAKAAAEADVKARQVAEARLKEAEAKVAEAEARARQETAAKIEAEQRARASDAEAKARIAELRAREAEAKLKAVQDRVDRSGGPVLTPPTTGSGSSTTTRPPTGPVLTPPLAVPVPGKAVPAKLAAQPEPADDKSTLLGGVVLAVDGGSHMQQSAPEGAARLDLAWGVGATGHLGFGPSTTQAYVALLAGVRYFQYVGFDSTANPKQAPDGLAWSIGLAFPRLAGLQTYIQSHSAQMQAGIGDFEFTTFGVRMAVAPKTGYFAFGFEGLINSSRAQTDIALTDEVGYGPTARFFVEAGFNLANGGLSK